MRRALGGVALLLAGCQAPVANNASDPDAEFPTRALILPGRAAEGLLRQCSRDVPASPNGTWEPTGADITALESGLYAAVKHVPKGASSSPIPPEFTEANWRQKWGRRYVGITRDGRRYIYGDFGPDGHGPVCDGGPAFFGVEYDVEAKRFTHVAFNGEA